MNQNSKSSDRQNCRDNTTLAKKITQATIPNKNGGGGSHQSCKNNGEQGHDENHDGGDDDDLPESLKRFGKEMVEKIRNEIMDCGDPVTFNDIAGLEGPKRIIEEVVCWPMKRPDLFTGLRRAPNGLLLYGPPGKLKGKVVCCEKNFCWLFVD